MTSENLKQQLRRLILHQEAQKYTVARLDGSEVQYPHQSDYLTESNLDNAISGVSTGSQFALHTIGIMLAQDKTGLTKAGCIDIDTPRDVENMKAGYALAQRLQQTAKNCGLNAYIEFSGGRGYHLWIFAQTAIKASLMPSCLRAIALQADFEGAVNLKSSKVIHLRYPPGKARLNSWGISSVVIHHKISPRKISIEFLGDKFSSDSSQISPRKISIEFLGEKFSSDSSQISPRKISIEFLGDKLREPVFKYSRALHDFEPIEFQVENKQKEEDI